MHPGKLRRKSSDRVVRFRAQDEGREFIVLTFNDYIETTKQIAFGFLSEVAVIASLAVHADYSATVSSPGVEAIAGANYPAFGIEGFIAGAHVEFGIVKHESDWNLGDLILCLTRVFCDSFVHWVFDPMAFLVLEQGCDLEVIVSHRKALTAFIDGHISQTDGSENWCGYGKVLDHCRLLS